MNSAELLIAKLDEAAERKPTGRLRDVQRNTRVLLDALRRSSGETVLVARAGDLCSLDHERINREIAGLGKVTLKCVWMRRSRTGDVIHPRIAQVRRSYSEPWPSEVSTVIVFVPHLLEPSVALTLLLEAAELFRGARLRCVSHCLDKAVAEDVKQHLRSQFDVTPEVHGRIHFDSEGRFGLALTGLLWEGGELTRDEPGLIPPIVSYSMRRQVEARVAPPSP